MNFGTLLQPEILKGVGGGEVELGSEHAQKRGVELGLPRSIPERGSLILHTWKTS